MNRTEFLKTMGNGALAVCAACTLMHCESESVAPMDVDFTIDISQNPFTALQTIGGSAIKDSVIMARISAGEIVAVTKACTHQGTTVQYQHVNNRFHCPNHDSNFSTNGEVLNGPARQSLQQFSTELIGTTLHVFS